jgi:hypothetical protein
MVRLSQAVTKGINAMATTKVTVKPIESMLKYNRAFSGSGTDTDIVVSSVRTLTLSLSLSHALRLSSLSFSLCLPLSES